MKPFTQGILVGVAVSMLVLGSAVVVGGKLLWSGLQLARQAIASETAEASETRTFPIKGLKRLSVSTDVGDLSIEAADVSAVQVVAKRLAKADTLAGAQERLKEIQWTSQIRRGVLVLRQQNPTGERAGLGEPRGELHFTVKVPKKAALRIQARTGVGNMKLAGLAGPATGEAGVGDVRARDMLGDLDLEAGTGDVVVEGGHGKLKAETGVGSLQVRGRSARGSNQEAMTLKTGTGDIEAELGAIAAPAELETGIGSIALTATRKGNAKFDLTAGIGEVKNDIKDAKIPADAPDDETVLVLGKGQHLITATTGTGDIRLQPAD